MSAPVPPRADSVGPAAGTMQQPPPPRPAGTEAPVQNQQQLNGIVLEYLSKKGYTRTEAMLRRESANVDSLGHPIADRPDEVGAARYFKAYDLLRKWIDNVLDIYKPELNRILWPIFVYSFLDIATGFNKPNDATNFFSRYREPFEIEHENDIRMLSAISLPEHVQQNETAQLYKNNRYRLTLSQIAFMTLVQFLESKESEGGSVINHIMADFMDVRSVDRSALGSDRSLARMLARPNGEEQSQVPAEDEGIPGHHPGSANLDPKAPTVLSKLSLGPAPLEQDLMEDVKAELQEHDVANPPGPGQNSLVEEFEQRIKPEPLDEPPRDALPFPPSTARDVLMEVQKVKENRDRFQIPSASRTGGVGPGISVTMFTLHNTFDTVNCIEFSGDNSLIAVGTAESYIKVWSLDNKPLSPSSEDNATQQPTSTRRLIGHSGPVYALSFSPSIAIPASTAQTNGHADDLSDESQPRYLLSSSADCTVRLWSLSTWSALVVYKSHSSPVWDVRFSPHGHYFLTGSADRTARLWSTPQIAPLRLLVGHDADVEVVAWHPNSAYVFTASGTLDRTVRMWDLQRGSAVRIFTGHTGSVTALTCSPSGKVVASADDRGDILLWDIAAGRLIKRMRGHSRGGVWSLDWSVESTVLVSGGADGTVRVWDVQTKNEANGKVVSDGTNGVKIDNATVTAPLPSKAKSKKDVVVSADQISAFPTKKSPVYKVRFTQMNLVVAGGAYLP